MASLFRAYNALLIRRPMLAQCGTAALLFGTGAQQLIEKKGLRRHDFTRTVRLTFYGGALFGPVMTWWYQFLNRIQFASPTRAIVYRVWLDQAVLTPFAVGAFFTCMSVLEGVPQEAYPRIQAAYVPTILRNWGVFIPTQIINFALVPHHMRFVVVTVVSLFWSGLDSRIGIKLFARYISISSISCCNFNDPKDFCSHSKQCISENFPLFLLPGTSTRPTGDLLHHPYRNKASSSPTTPTDLGHRTPFRGRIPSHESE